MRSDQDHSPPFASLRTYLPFGSSLQSFRAIWSPNKSIDRQIQNFSSKGTRQKNIFYPLPQHLPIGFNDHSSILSLLTISNKSIPVCSRHKQRAHHPMISSNFAFQPNFLLPKKQKSRAESAITLSLNKSNRSPTIRTFPVFLTHQLLSS